LRRRIKISANIFSNTYILRPFICSCRLIYFRQKDFNSWKEKFNENYDYYNMLEKNILNINQDCANMQTIDQIIHKIKQLAIEMSSNEIVLDLNNTALIKPI
jgi:hypothetical protein